jgi:hypothetical protein
MFKIGKLIGKAGSLCWKSFRDDDRLIMSSADIGSVAGSQFSRALINSVQKKDLSVLTPSYTSRHCGSQTPKTMTFHMSNPNPQPFSTQRYKGLRDQSYTTGKVDPEYDMHKYGKKMHLAKPTSE